MPTTHTPFVPVLLALATLAGLAEAQPREDEAARRKAEIEELVELEADVTKTLARLRGLRVERPSYRLALYDIRHLLYDAHDRPAPLLTIPTNSAGYRTGAGAGGGSFSFEDEEEDEGTVLDPDYIETIVTNGVGEDLWDDPAQIEIHRGMLIVNQTDIGHARIRQILDDLTQGALRGVQLEVQFYDLPVALREKVRSAALAQDGVLPASLLAELDGQVAQGAAGLLRSAMLTALNDQRTSLHQGHEQSFVAGYRQAAGGTAENTRIVADPRVDVLRTGLALDIRPSILGEGEDRRIAMDVRFVRTRIGELEQRTTPWGNLDVPRLLVDSVRTSAKVPPGSGMLIFAAYGGKPEEGGDVTILVRPLIVAPKTG